MRKWKCNFDESGTHCQSNQYGMGLSIDRRWRRSLILSAINKDTSPYIHGGRVFYGTQERSLSRWPFLLTFCTISRVVIFFIKIFSWRSRPNHLLPVIERGGYYRFLWLWFPMPMATAAIWKKCRQLSAVVMDKEKDRKYESRQVAMNRTCQFHLLHSKPASSGPQRPDRGRCRSSWEPVTEIVSISLSK